MAGTFRGAAVDAEHTPSGLKTMPTSRLLLTAAVALWLTACASTPATPPPAHDYATRESVLEDALGEIGRPYVYGGADADGFDCSGLVHYVYGEAGVSVPRTAAQLLRSGNDIPLSSAAPGDLVFFRIDGGLHVTIYVGNGKVVHAPASGQTVTVSKIGTGYWREHYLATVRILN